MKVALFVPCFIDAFFPDVAVATLELLERFGCEVAYPLDQTCCGQPMANSGCHTDAAGAEALFVRNFAGSHARCVLFFKVHIHFRRRRNGKRSTTRAGRRAEAGRGPTGRKSAAANLEA